MTMTTNSKITDPMMSEVVILGLQYGYRGVARRTFCCWDPSDWRRIQIIFYDDQADTLIPQGYFHVSDFLTQDYIEDHRVYQGGAPWDIIDVRRAIRAYFKHLADDEQS